jgi:hypothetical protein
LDRIAKADSDTEFARKMQKAKQELFRLCAQAGVGIPEPLRDGQKAEAPSVASGSTVPKGRTGGPRR